MKRICINNKFYWLLNADDEEPDCGKCDHQDGCELCDLCGPKYGWHYFNRTELEKD